MANQFHDTVSYILSSQLTMESEGHDYFTQDREKYGDYGTLHKKFVPSLSKEK